MAPVDGYVPRLRFAPPLEAARRPRDRRAERIAVVLHGKIGSFYARALEGASADPRMVALSYRSLVRHVVQPNIGAYAVDVFGHSWSPEVGQLIDALYEPRRSKHQPAQFWECPVAFDPRYCSRTRSHVEGIRRAMALKRDEERATGVAYEAVLLSRWDVVWQEELRFAALPGWQARAPTAAWLPHHCSDSRPREHEARGSMRQHVCGGKHSGFRVPVTSVECHWQERACQKDLSPQARAIFLVDWWVIFRPSRAADVFANGMVSRWTQDLTQISTTLHRPPNCAGVGTPKALGGKGRREGADACAVQDMGHLHFGMQLVWKMNATLRFVFWPGVDYTLGRMWAWTRQQECYAIGRADDETTGRAVAGECAGRACAAGDLLRRPWQHGATHTKEALEPTQWPPAATYATAADDPKGACLAGAPAEFSCPDRSFFCGEGSAMCAEAAKGLEPFDRKVPRSLFLECGEAACRAQVMLDRGYTPTAGTTAQLTGGECAAVLLALLLQTEASVPPANASAAGRAVDPGREQRRRAATAALRDQAERLRAAGARLGKAWAKAWPPSCAAPVRSLLSESPGLCSPLVELRAARAAAIAAKRTHSRIKKRGGNITIIDSEEAWGDCRRDERGGWGGNDDHGEPIVAARDTCRQRCDGCVNCRFWSWSATTRECFWSRQCAAPPAPPMAKGKGSGSAATAVLAKSSLASRAVFASSYSLHKEGDEKTFVTVQGSGLVSIRHVRPSRSDSPVATVRAAASRWAVG